VHAGGMVHGVQATCQPQADSLDSFPCMIRLMKAFAFGLQWPKSCLKWPFAFGLKWPKRDRKSGPK